jgi:phosphatidylglycerol lysyltransferase
VNVSVNECTARAIAVNDAKTPTPNTPSAAASDIDAAARALVTALVRRHGWNATSFQVLEPGYRYFFAGDDACVAYVDTGRAWVAAGAPLAPEHRLAEVTATFIAAARAAGRRACLFATEERFTDIVPLKSLPIGEQAVWDPADWPAALARSRRLREQLRRARAKGIRVRTVDLSEAAGNEPTRAAISALVQRWLRSRELAPMGFVVQIEPLTLLPEHRLFVAELAELAELAKPADTAGAREGAPSEDELVALLSMAPIYARNGWSLQHLVRAPEAPNGTTETLIDHAMRWAAGQGAAFLTLGLAPLAGDVPVPLRLARRAGRALFDFEGLRAFKAKLRPARWDRAFLSFPPEVGAVRAVLDVLAAFARGGLLRFGLRTLMRGPMIVVRLLAWLLIPWTALLASTDAHAWFPRPAIKWAWVIFDATLAIALGVLHRRWRDGLARAITAAIGADAALTLFEGIAWNAPRITTLGGAAVLALAIAAPIAAFATLWRARVRGSAAATPGGRPA